MTPVLARLLRMSRKVRGRAGNWHSHTCGTVRSAQETVKHIARVSVRSRRGTLKILTTENSDLGLVVLSA
jgi:hypothetical protein